MGVPGTAVVIEDRRDAHGSGQRRASERCGIRMGSHRLPRGFLPCPAVIPRRKWSCLRRPSNPAALGRSSRDQPSAGAALPNHLAQPGRALQGRRRTGAGGGGEDLGIHSPRCQPMEHRRTRGCHPALPRTPQRGPQTFVWTRAADDILANIARFCLRTSKAGGWPATVDWGLWTRSCIPACDVLSASPTGTARC